MSSDIISPDEYYHGEFSLDIGNERLYRHTTQILYREGNETPLPVASSVLVSCGERRFLVTAAHLLNEFNLNNLGYLHSDGFYILGGKVIFTDIVKSKINNKIDLAIWELDSETVSRLKLQYDFFDLRSFNIDHDLEDQIFYQIIGYPIRKTKKNPKTGITEILPYSCTTQLSKVSFDKVQADRNYHALFFYQKAKTKNVCQIGTNQGPDFEGMSGCGIWKTPKPVVLEGASPPYYCNLNRTR